MTPKERVAALKAQGLKQSEIAVELGVTAARVSQLVKQLREEGGAEAPTEAKKKTKPKAKSSSPPGSAERIGGRRPPPGPNNGSFKKGNPGGPGTSPEKAMGNDNATKTGLRRNPMMHDVSPERAARVSVTEDDTPADLIRRSIEIHQLSIADMTREIEAILASRKVWWWLGSTYTRQQGDGEIMGTGRISNRKRMTREEAARQMMEARSRVQGKLDSAIAKLHTMLTDGEGKRKRGLADLLAAMRAGGDDD
jgi:hypothetical protein